MSKLLPAALSAVTMTMLGIVALSYRRDSLAGQSLSGNEQEAFNLTVEVSTDATSIVGNALPRLLMVVIIVFAIILLLMTR